MKSTPPHACEDMLRSLADENSPLLYLEKMREFGVKLFGLDAAFDEIYYCPWCGAELPGSLRDEWFERIEELGLELFDPRVPKELQTDEWWRNDPNIRSRTSGSA